jgi:hypothetical protein
VAEAQGGIAQIEVALREGDFDAGLFEETPDVIIGLAFDLRMTARPVRPDEQTKVERRFAEA